MTKTEEELIWESYTNYNISIGDIHNILMNDNEVAQNIYDGYYDLYPNYREEFNEDEEYYFDSKQQYENYLEEIKEFISLPKQFLIYRAVYLKTKSDLDEEMLGTSWSLYKDSALEFGIHNSSNYILTGEINIEDVDIEKTISLYFIFSSMGNSDSENEIVVKDYGEKVKLVKIEKINYER